MASATNYLEEAVLKHVFRITSFTQPAANYMALHTADPTETGATGEVTGGSYARQAVTFEWNSPAAENDGLIRFDGMPAATVTHWSIWDAVSGGNCLAKGAFSSSLVVGSGSSVEIADNDLSITMD